MLGHSLNPMTKRKQDWQRDQERGIKFNDKCVGKHHESQASESEMNWWDSVEGSPPMK